jgi:hypothetical protein
MGLGWLAANMSTSIVAIRAPQLAFVGGINNKCFNTITRGKRQWQSRHLHGAGI